MGIKVKRQRCCCIPRISQTKQWWSLPEEEPGSRTWTSCWCQGLKTLQENGRLSEPDKRHLLSVELSNSVDLGDIEKKKERDWWTHRHTHYGSETVWVNITISSSQAISAHEMLVYMFFQFVMQTSSFSCLLMCFSLLYVFHKRNSLKKISHRLVCCT